MTQDVLVRHEHGHASVAAALGVPVRRVDLVGDGRYGGIVHTDCDDPVTVDELRTKAKIILGGILAQPDAGGYEARTDRAQLAQILEVTGDDLATLRREVRRLQGSPAYTRARVALVEAHDLYGPVLTGDALDDVNAIARNARSTPRPERITLPVRILNPSPVGQKVLVPAGRRAHDEVRTHVDAAIRERATGVRTIDVGALTARNVGEVMGRMATRAHVRDLVDAKLRTPQFKRLRERLWVERLATEMIDEHFEAKAVERREALERLEEKCASQLRRHLGLGPEHQELTLEELVELAYAEAKRQGDLRQDAVALDLMIQCGGYSEAARTATPSLAFTPARQAVKRIEDDLRDEHCMEVAISAGVFEEPGMREWAADVDRRAHEAIEGIPAPRPLPPVVEQDPLEIALDVLDTHEKVA